MLRAALLAALALLLLPAVAGAYVVRERGGLEAPANGIVLGPTATSGSRSPASEQVRRGSRPGGQVLGTLPGRRRARRRWPTGGGGGVWVAGTGSDTAVLDRGADRDLAVGASRATGRATCGPVGITSGGNGRMYFCAPDAGRVRRPDQIGRVDDDGSGTADRGRRRGRAFDVAVAGGKLYVPSSRTARPAVRPDHAGARTRRSACLATRSRGRRTASRGWRRPLWVTIFRATGNNVARFPAAAQDGGRPRSRATGSETMPFGIVGGADGRDVRRRASSAEIVRIDAATGAIDSISRRRAARRGRSSNGPDGDI